MRRLAAIAPLIAIVAIGLPLRFAPIGYGLPASYHPDETHLLFDLGRLLGGLALGGPSVEASTFHYPLSLAYAGYYLVGRLTGEFASLAAFQDAVLLDRPAFHLIGRGVAAAMSVAALVMTYVVGRATYGGTAGLFAALLMTFSVVDISSSQWLKLDSTVTFMSLAVLWAIGRLVGGRTDTRAPWVAALVLGLGLATRVDLGLLLPLLAAGLVLRRARPSEHGHAREQIHSWRLAADLLMALAIVAGTYLIVSFNLALFFFREVLGRAPIFTTREVVASLKQYVLAGDVLDSVLHNAPFYFRSALLGTLGAVPVALIAAGLVRAVREWRPQTLLLLAYLALTVPVLLAFNVYATHYVLPRLPVLAILAAGGLLWFMETLRVERQGLVAACFAIALAQPAYYSVEHVWYVTTNVDSRVRARDWLHAHVPFGERIAAQKFYELPAYLPPLQETRAQVEQKLAITRAERRSSGLAFEKRLREYPTDTYEIVSLSIEHHWSPSLENRYDLDRLKADGVRYIVLSGWSTPSLVDMDGSPMGILIVERLLDHEGLARYAAFMARLAREARLVAEFGPRSRRIARRTDAPIDPTIAIYELL